MSDRVVSTTDSIAYATTTPPKENHPQESPRTEASEVENRYTAPQLATKLEISRQAIESARDKGTLSEIGYTAEKNGRNWFYYPLENVIAP